MNNLKSLFYGILILVGITYITSTLLYPTKVKTVFVEVPSKSGKSDTIYLPTPVYINNPSEEKLLKDNEVLLEGFKQADSSLKVKKYKESIEIKEYKEVFKDTFQTVEVYTKTRGEVLEQAISYKTNEYTLTEENPLKTPLNKSIKVYGGLEVGIPMINSGDIVFKPTIRLDNVLGGSFSIGLDTKGRGWIGYHIRL